MANLLVMDGPLKGMRASIDQHLSRVGRREGNDWVLADASVSGTHCEIERINNGFLIRDLGSTNGTKVNSEPIKEHPLYANDIIMIGEVPVMIDGDDVPQAAKTEPCYIPRTAIIIQKERIVESPPIEFGARSNANKIWWAVIVLLILVIIGLLLILFKGMPLDRY